MRDKYIVDRELPLWKSCARAIYRWVVRSYPFHNKLVQIRRNGLYWLVWANEDIGKKLIVTRSFERAEMAVFKKHVKSGDVIFDVGANVGYYAVTLAHYRGDITVFAFEPLTRNAAVIEVTCGLNAVTNVRVIRSVVSSSTEPVLFTVPGGDGAYGHMSVCEPNSADVQLKVPSTTVDEFVASNDVRRVDVMKVDVEGAEVSVLIGAEKLFSSSEKQPRIVMVEVADEYLGRFGSTAADIFHFMSRFGYSAYRAVGTSGELQPYTVDTRDGFNVFFLRNDN